MILDRLAIGIHGFSKTEIEAPEHVRFSATSPHVWDFYVLSCLRRGRSTFITGASIFGGDLGYDIPKEGIV